MLIIIILEIKLVIIYNKAFQKAKRVKNPKKKNYELVFSSIKKLRRF